MNGNGLKPVRHSQNGGSLTEKLSGVLGRTPRGVSQALYGPDSLDKKMERLLFQLCRFGARELAEKMVDRFQHVLSGQVSPITLLDGPAQVADMDEDVAEKMWELDKTPENLERLCRATEKQAYTSAAKARALRSDQRTRGWS